MEPNITLSEFIKYLKALEYEFSGDMPIVVRGPGDYGFEPIVSKCRLAKNDNKFVVRRGRDAFVIDIRQEENMILSAKEARNIVWDGHIEWETT